MFHQDKRLYVSVVVQKEKEMSVSKQEELAWWPANRITLNRAV